MARKPKGISIHQYDAWVKQGRPTGTFEYRGKTIQAPIDGLYGIMERGGGPNLYTPDQLEKMKEKIESAQEKIGEELKALKIEAKRLWRQDESHAKELGEVLIKIRDKSLKRGDFKEWWMAEGFTQHRVSYCLRVAEDKVKEGKKKTKESARVVALSSIHTKLSSLYSAIEKGTSAEEVSKLVEDIIGAVQGLVLTVEAKKKAPKKARAAGAGK
jgi:predicted transcriptional regulator